MKIFHSIVTVGGITLISRLTGFIRDALIASLFGVSGVTDAFFVAFKLPNLFRRLFAEGAFNAAFIPLFSGIFVTSGNKLARAYAEQVFVLMVLGLSCFVIFFEVFMPLVISVIAPGFHQTPERYTLAVSLARITFPYILFISVTALFSGVLNSLGKFAAAAAAPVLLNITIIFALGMIYLFGYDVYALAWAVFIAGVVQLIWLWVFAGLTNIWIFMAKPTINNDVKKLVKLGIPGALGAGVIQVNLFIDTIFASCLSSGAVSFLFYADRLNQLPLGVIGIAISTALLPELSKQIKTKKFEDAHKMQNRAVEAAMAITFPAAVGLIVLAIPLVTVLFERGAFSHEDAVKTGYTLAAFASGLPAYVLVKIFGTHFFARQDTRIPMITAIISVFVNFILNFCLIIPLEYVGLALATSLAAWVNALLLGGILVRRYWLCLDDQLLRTLPRLGIASIMMGIVCYFGQFLFENWLVAGLWPKVFALSFLVISGALSYIISARCVRAFHFRELFKFLKKQTI